MEYMPWHIKSYKSVHSSVVLREGIEYEWRKNKIKLTIIKARLSIARSNIFLLKHKDATKYRLNFMKRHGRRSGMS